MKIAVLSDSHDNIWKLDAAMSILSKADAVLHCGDLCSPFMVKRMAEDIQAPIHVVWGNNDGDRFNILKLSQNYQHIHIEGPYCELNLGGREIAMTHYPQIACAAAHSGQYDLVCYGHDHTAYQERVGSCLVLNPGELMGLRGRSTVACVDLETMEAEVIEI